MNVYLFKLNYEKKIKYILLSSLNGQTVQNILLFFSYSIHPIRLRRAETVYI